MCLQVILLSNIFTNHLSISLSYSGNKEVLNGVSNVVKMSETAMVESTSVENLVSINLLLLYWPNKEFMNALVSSDTCFHYTRGRPALEIRPLFIKNLSLNVIEVFFVKECTYLYNHWIYFFFEICSITPAVSVYN
jgi:hypothetical protein